MAFNEYQREELELLMKFALDLLIENKITSSEQFFESEVYNKIKMIFNRESAANLAQFKDLLDKRKEYALNLTEGNMDSCWTIFTFSVVQAFKVKSSGITEMTATPMCADLFYDEADKIFLEHQSITVQNRILSSMPVSYVKAVPKFSMGM